MSPRHCVAWYVTARERCEYCLFPDAVGFYPHEIDHVVAEKHGGQTIENNLCLSCWECNSSCVRR